MRLSPWPSTRVVSALVLAPAVLLALYLGPPASVALVAFAGAVMAAESVALAQAERDTVPRVVAGAGMACALILGGTAAGEGFFAAILAFAALAFATLAFVAWRALEGGARRVWPLLALVYIGAACLAFMWLRDRPAVGLALVVWLLAVVWTTDTAAMWIGRRFGRARLAPAVSPNKTWAGLAGGMAGAGAVGGGLAWVWPAVLAGLPVGSLAGAALLGAGLAVVAQLGDLLESVYKRRFGAKDSGRIMPGHGGLLDRADGVLSASLLLAAILGTTQGAS